jgi:hypothetical protein
MDGNVGSAKFSAPLSFSAWELTEQYEFTVCQSAFPDVTPRAAFIARACHHFVCALLKFSIRLLLFQSNVHTWKIDIYKTVAQITIHNFLGF